MIKLSMEIDNGEVQVNFDLPFEPGETLSLTELALFSLHLDVIKHRITDLTNSAIAKGDGYDMISSPE